MVSMITPGATVAPKREKAPLPLKSSRPNSSPWRVVAVVVILLLCLSGLWRATHNTVRRPMAKVVTVARDLPPGVRVSFPMLRFMDIPKKLVTQEMVTSLDDIVDHETRTFIPAGEPIRSAMFFHGHAGIPSNLAPNERSITLQLNDDAMVDHCLRPDDRVDVLVTSSKENKKYTKTVCQSARVLICTPKEQLLARQMSSIGSNKVTLAVTADMAEMLTEAAEVGKIRLVLRSSASAASTAFAADGADPDDLLPASARVTQSQQEAEGAAAAQHQLLPPPPTANTSSVLQESEPVPPPGPLQWMVEIISGSHKETVSVPQE